ncbi:GNAT family N-acetyltransferase [Mycobacterium sp. MAC_011194_8550]|jgi:GNAT superfamily N-acetyltransferase|uniref:GNAT family N-acetyltransferase n=2 Tax=unclassified Mycobacterium avium complex (MAC) TaxID=2750822 RepID=UPI00067EBCC2|nr:GNAT family N-acetyltransferase [Mycobacterium sp. MAC_011194_8550]
MMVMARHDVQIRDTSCDELANLGEWFAMAGIQKVDQEATAQLIAARESGVLGTAIGRSSRENLDRLMTTPFNDWYFARGAVKTLEVDGEVAGILWFGAHFRLWKQMIGDRDGGTVSLDVPESWPDWFRQFIATAMHTAKLHLVAVHPDYRGQGYGSRLVKRALKIADRGRIVMLYGQFSSQRTELRKFYGERGFDVLASGEPLPMGMATGSNSDRLRPKPDETFFVRHRTL